MALEHLKLLNQLAQDPDLPQKLGLPAGEVRQRLRRAKALYHLYAFYGNVKAGRRLHALRWLSGALALRPTILLDRRWRRFYRAAAAYNNVVKFVLSHNIRTRPTCSRLQTVASLCTAQKHRSFREFNICAVLLRSMS